MTATPAFTVDVKDQALVSVRAARGSDATALELLYRELVADPAVSVLAERIERLANDPNTVILVAGAEGRVQGTALLTFCEDVMYRDQPFALVENIVVAAASRGKGVGRALLLHVEALAMERHCSKIMLLSASAREAAHRFFEGAGFNGTAKRGFVKYRRDFGTGTP